MESVAAYYNEIDPFAVAWLRELIKAGHIAPGEVDERSITDLEPTDLRGFTQCHFFAGIGVWSYALRAAGWPDDSRIWTGSCPCQSFSASGKRGGFSDQRHLWPAWFRLIRESRPNVVFGEQVASKDGLAWFDVVSADMEGAGYAIGAADICAAGFGAPHIRQRLYFVADANKRQRGWERNRAHNYERNGQISLVANSHQPDTSPEGLQRSGQLGRTAEDGCVLAMADAGNSERRQGAVGRNDNLPAKTGRIEGASSVRECGGVSELADANHVGWGGRRTGEAGDESREIERLERFRATGDMGHATLNGSRSFDGEPRPGNGQEIATGGSSISDQLGHATERGLGVCGSAPGNGGRTALASETDELGDAEESRSPRRGRRPILTELIPTSLTNGFWRDAEWLWCRDQKYRPVEPGTFPLVTGAPARVGRLRGYGNALNAEVATGFIEAYREVTTCKP